MPAFTESTETVSIEQAMLLPDVYITQNINEETNAIFNWKFMMHMHTVYTAKDDTTTTGVDTATVHMAPLLVHADLPSA